MIGFKSMTRTTRTIIVITNLEVDINELYEIIPITPYTPPVKQKGRRKKGVVIQEPVLESGSIISAKYAGKCKGHSSKKSKTAFKNSVTIVMDVDGKKVNFKLSKSGRFQVTGNNSDDRILSCVKVMWNLIRENKSIYKINGPVLEATMWPSMENFKTNIGFRLDRQSLNTYVNTCTEYISVFETSSGSASVNIKMPLEFDDIDLGRVVEKPDGTWEKSTVLYSDFVASISGKLTKKEGRYVSFLVFHTGEVIMTSMTESIMEPYFNKFMEIIGDCRDIII